jgi:bifunctional DNase/RNase
MISKISRYLKCKKTTPIKIKLEILGISYTTYAEQKIYIVILGEENGDRRVPVVVSFYEAQAIAIEIEKIQPMTPLIFDVFKKMVDKNKLKFKEILITDFKKDILLTYIVSKKEHIELRTADALALSVRLDCPIYIYDDVLSVVDNVVKKYYNIRKASEQVIPDQNFTEEFSINELNDLLQKAIEEEEYEKASEIRDEILKKKKDS